MSPEYTLNMKEKGTVFHLQHYALHDGPGIRTTVFFKGCPLRCLWCHNPESLFSRKELVFWPDRCLACGICLESCPQFHSPDISPAPGKDTLPSLKHPAPAGNQCQLCGRCARNCPAEALELSGRDMTVAEVMAVLDKDALFYQESGGGVTFSGGEPLMQPVFLKALLTASWQRGWHTTVDTCGYAPTQVIEEIMPLVDLFLFDLKHLDDTLHRKVTGVSNRLILENLDLLLAEGKTLRIRFPVIPGINDDPDHLHALGRYLQQRKLSILHLLPYHAIGTDKYTQRGLDYQLPHLISPAPQQLLDIQHILSGYGLEVIEGG